MVRRRSTVRFRNGAQVDDLIRKDSNGSWMPVGTNGCHQGAESPATPLLRGTGQPQAQPGAVHAGPPEEPRPVPRPVSGQRGTKPAGIYVTSAMAATGVRQSRRAVPSRAASAGVILRAWELITRPGCHQRPGQCEHCRSRSRSWTSPRAEGAASQIPADCHPEVYDEGFWSRVDPGPASSALPDPPPLWWRLRCPWPGPRLAIALSRLVV